jgi:hypothetical protein
VYTDEVYVDHSKAKQKSRVKYVYVVSVSEVVSEDTCTRYGRGMYVREGKQSRGVSSEAAKQRNTEPCPPSVHKAGKESQGEGVYEGGRVYVGMEIYSYVREM